MRSRKEECLPFAERSTGLEKGERELRIVNQKKEVTGGKGEKIGVERQEWVTMCNNSPKNRKGEFQQVSP